MGSANDGPGWVLLAIPVMFGPALLLWRSNVRPSLTVREEGISVRNPFREWLILPWAGVADVTPGYSGIEIRRRSGVPVTAIAVQKWNMASWTWPRMRADEVCGEIMRLLS